MHVRDLVLDRIVIKCAAAAWFEHSCIDSRLERIRVDDFCCVAVSFQALVEKMNPLALLSLAQVVRDEIYWQQFTKTVEDLELSKHLEVEVSVSQRHNNLLLDLVFVVNEVVLAKTLVCALCD